MGKIINFVLIGFAVLASSLLVWSALTSDRLTAREAIEKITAANEPCRSAFTSALELFAEDDADAARKASAQAEPVCRESHATLDGINIFVSSDDLGEERDKRGAFEACARLSLARADFLRELAADAPDEKRMAEQNAELASADTSCAFYFGRLPAK